MIQKKQWSEFHETGLLLVINQILHIFGWAIVFSFDEQGNVEDVYPARVKFRGFDNKSVEDSYAKVSKFMLDNAEELHEEASE
jgi:uncharacterized protein YfbU (UPF0304 family)